MSFLAYSVEKLIGTRQLMAILGFGGAGIFLFFSIIRPG
jgi:hypothetical protein